MSLYWFEGVVVICSRAFLGLKKGDDIYMMYHVTLALEKEKNDIVFSLDLGTLLNNVKSWCVRIHG